MPLSSSPPKATFPSGLTRSLTALAQSHGQALHDNGLFNAWIRAAVVSAARDAVLENWPGDDFHVNVHPDTGNIPQLFAYVHPAPSGADYVEKNPSRFDKRRTEKLQKAIDAALTEALGPHASSVGNRFFSPFKPGPGAVDGHRDRAQFEAIDPLETVQKLRAFLLENQLLVALDPSPKVPRPRL